MAENKKAASAAKKAKKQAVEVKEAVRRTPLTATVTIPPQYSTLNVRAEPNGTIVGTLKNGESVTVGDGFTLENGECWRQIGEKQFVKENFLKFE